MIVIRIKEKVALVTPFNKVVISMIFIQFHFSPSVRVWMFELHRFRYR